MTALLLGLPAYARGGNGAAEAVGRFHREYSRATSDDGRIAAVSALAVTRHRIVAAALAPLLVRAPIPVRIVAARELGRFSGIEGAGGPLLGALVDPRNSGANARGVRIEILRSLGALRVREALPAVDRLIEDKDVWTAKAAVDAAGKIRGRSSIDALLRALRRVEGPQGDRGLGLDVYEGDLPATSILGIVEAETRGEPEDRPKTERELLREPILAALASIAKVSYPGLREWESWWRVRRSRFTVPP